MPSFIAFHLKRKLVCRLEKDIFELKNNSKDFLNFLSENKPEKKRRFSLAQK